RGRADRRPHEARGRGAAVLGLSTPFWGRPRCRSTPIYEPAAVMHESSESSRVWQVDLGNRSDLVFMLRDFLRRNEIDTTVSGPAALELTTAGRRDDLETMLVQWEAVTGVKAELRGRPKPVTMTDQGMVGRPRLG